jgi:hypothetical protein
VFSLPSSSACASCRETSSYICAPPHTAYGHRPAAIIFLELIFFAPSPVKVAPYTQQHLLIFTQLHSFAACLSQVFQGTGKPRNWKVEKRKCCISHLSSLLSLSRHWKAERRNCHENASPKNLASVGPTYDINIHTCMYVCMCVCIHIHTYR